MQPTYSFGQWLKQRRRALDLTQEELARRVGLAAVSLRKIEADERRPSQQIATLLADQLGVPEAEREAFLHAARAERAVDQLAPATTFPPTASMPVSTTPLLGREADLAALADYLADPTIRLITLVGPPGIGKTRLSVQLAQNAHLQTTFVALAPVSDADLVLPTIAQALGVRENDGVSTLRERLRNVLQSPQLLVLDNFEQLLPAAPQLADLLTLAPNLRLLVTSRAPLRLSGEHEYAVPPLSLPDPAHLPLLDQLRAYPAIHLFVQRARAADASFQLGADNAAEIAAICARLDGLPLAIELAAARIKLFPPRTLRARLDGNASEPPLTMLSGGARDLPARQQTLRNAIAWSYQLLSPLEQRCFDWLGVFVGGWSYAQAEALWRQQPGTTPPLETLSALVDHSLVRQTVDGMGEARFLLLETLREYALERLHATGEMAAAQRAHAMAFFELAQQAEPWLNTQHRYPWLKRLESDHDNLRAALAWSFAAAGQDATLRTMAVQFVGALAWFWVERGHLREGRRRFDQARALSETTPQTLLHAQTLRRAAMICNFLGDYAAARPMLETSLAISTVLDDQRELAHVQGDLSWMLMQQGEQTLSRQLNQASLTTWQALGNLRQLSRAWARMGYLSIRLRELDAAREYFDHALALARTYGDALEIVEILDDIGHLDFLQGNHAQALARAEEALALMRQATPADELPDTLNAMAWTAYRSRDYARAATLFGENLDIARAHSPGPDLAWALNHMGDIYRAQGNDNQAAECYNESLRRFQELSHAQGIAAVTHNQAYLACHQKQFENARAMFTACLETFHAVGYTWSVGDALAGLAVVATLSGEWERATVLLGAAQALQQRVDASGLFIDPANHDERAQALATLHQQLDPTHFEAAWATGAAMPLDDAVAYGLMHDQ